MPRKRYWRKGRNNDSKPADFPFLLSPLSPSSPSTNTPSSTPVPPLPVPTLTPSDFPPLSSRSLSCGTVGKIGKIDTVGKLGKLCTVGKLGTVDKHFKYDNSDHPKPSMFMNKCDSQSDDVKLETKVRHNIKPCMLPDVIKEKDRCFQQQHDVIPTSQSPSRCVQALTHQGDIKRFGAHAGRQCMANSLTAMIRNQMKPAASWQKSDLDTILDDGNKLYDKLYTTGKISDRTYGHILVSEMPQTHVVSDAVFDVHIGNSFLGIVGNDSEDEVLSPFDIALHRMMFEYDSCFLTMHGNTCAIMKSGNGFALFDSHSRNKNGTHDENWKCVVIWHADITQLYDQLCCLASSIGAHGQYFEFTGLRLQTNGSEYILNASPMQDTQMDVDPWSTGSENTSAKNLMNLQSNVAKLHNLCDMYEGKACDVLTDMVLHEERNDPHVDHNDDTTITLPTNGTLATTSCGSGDPKCSPCFLLVNEEHVDTDVQNELHEAQMKANDQTMTECDDSEEVVIGDIQQTSFTFTPISYAKQSSLCNQLNLFNGNVEFNAPVPVTPIHMSSPCATKSIKSDGNCFYRALSFHICGSENAHMKVRKAIVQYLLENSTAFTQYLRQGYRSVEDYIRISRMKYCNTWATEVEIIAAAQLLCANIYIYNGTRWNMYKCPGADYTGIYLKHCNENHYEVVKCVNHISTVHQCAMLCTNTAPAFERQLRKDTKYAAFNSDDVQNTLMDKMSRSEYERDKYTAEFPKADRQKTLKRRKYHADANHQNAVKERMKRAYSTNVEYQEQVRERSKRYNTAKYASDRGFQAQKKQKSKDKYSNNTTHQENIKTYSKIRYEHDAQHQESVRTFSKTKYANDEKYQESVRAYSKTKYANDKKYQESVRAYSKTKYANDEKYQESVRTYSKTKYANDEKYQESVRTYSKTKYANDEKFQESVKAFSKIKYASDPTFQQEVKKYSTVKYHSNQKFQKDVNSHNTHRYHTDDSYQTSKLQGSKRQRVMRATNRDIDFAIECFKKNVKTGPQFVCSVCHRQLFRKQVLECKVESYLAKGGNVAAMACKCITYTYVHICSSQCQGDCKMHNKSSTLWICYTCHYKISKGKMPPQSAMNNLQLDPIPPELACLNSLEQHLIGRHIPFMRIVPRPKGGQNACQGPTTCVPSNIATVVNVLPRHENDDQMIIIELKKKVTYKGYYEKKHVTSKKVFDALHYLVHNNKYYTDVTINNEWNNPLQELQDTEPKDQQDIEPKSCDPNENNCEPMDDESHIQDTEEQCAQIYHSGEHNKDETRTTIDEEEEEELPLTYIEKQPGLFHDSCLQPVDIAQEVLDQHFDSVLTVAPAEENSPIKLLEDVSNEPKCFPLLFPKGSPTFHEERPEKITLAKYLEARLLNADGRFATNIDYIFYAQYISEVQQVLSQVSIALRKGSAKNIHDEDMAEILTNPDSLKGILQNNDGYKFLKAIRGTPPFWQSAQKDCFAMIRQLGIPTWFCSFSSADMRWEEMLTTLMSEQGLELDVEDLTYFDKCKLLKENPITAARIFDHRWHCFLKDVILSPAAPIGQIRDYFYRVEFQSRGSPHIHAMFWAEGAPKIDINPDSEVTDFVDKYITCELPSSDDEEMYEIVTSVQKHSTRHSKTCKPKTSKKLRKRKNTNPSENNKVNNETIVCRFFFPRPISAQTFIARAGKPTKAKKDKDDTNNAENSHPPNPLLSGEHTNDDNCNCSTFAPDPAHVVDEQTSCNNDIEHIKEQLYSIMTKDIADSILKRIREVISQPDHAFETTEDILDFLGISQTVLEVANLKLTNRTTVTLQRQPRAVWVNQYNKDLLRAWNANMDIQYVTDAYSCVVYMIAYMSKTETTSSLALRRAQEEIKHGNVSAKQAMRQLGSVYLHLRDVSAQESAYRAVGLHMKESSRKVVFIPTGENPMRMSKPLSVLKQGNEANKSSLWMTSIVDRYTNRPKTPQFKMVCLASFCSEYRVLSKAEVPYQENYDEGPVVQLNNNHGFVRRRTRTQAAVVRYPRLSPTKNPEKYYHSLLQLFLPYYENSHLKPAPYETFEDYYKHGTRVGVNNEATVKTIVDNNKSVYEKESERLEESEQIFAQHGELQDAWSQIFPETELERLECLELQQPNAENAHEQEMIPDLADSTRTAHMISLPRTNITKEHAYNLMRSLNEGQSQIFYKIRQWCLDTVHGRHPAPLKLFLTGGGGGGKSHLIKAIQYESSRILSQLCSNPDDTTVLLAAPTGVAAFNINCSTIHSTLCIGINITLPYQPLGEEKINSLRAKFAHLQILIIDEISMVDNRLLVYIHGRLRQIKQCGDYSLFGNVSIIAVGDFYQLPPVKGKPVYADIEGLNLWTHFEIAELTQIVRQKDPHFAELLTRLRIHKRNTPLLDSDIDTLKQRETGETSSALHIFATNRQVATHNITMLELQCDNVITIEAQDFERNPETGRLEQKQGQHTKVYNTSLESTFTTGVGARVMLTKNLDLAHGLVNGAFGCVQHIVLPSQDSFPTAIHIVFDHSTVGHKQRTTSTFPNTSQNVTVIHPEEETVAKNGGMRRQFPLRLAYACTVHKTQGLTVDKAVVSLKKIFSAGQSYVALSRVTSLTGLILQDFTPAAIYCNEQVKGALSQMPPFITPQSIDKQPNQFVITFHNIQSLNAHLIDLRANTAVMLSDCICLAETWLQPNTSVEHFAIENFTFQHNTRFNSYAPTHPITQTLKTQAHGGVGIYYRRNSGINVTIPSFTNIECLLFELPQLHAIAAVLYRPNSYAIDLFRQNLEQLIHEIDTFQGGKIVMGDFNEDLHKSCSIRTLFQYHGYLQLIQTSTTDHETIIDHVYVKDINNVKVNVLQTYYSFHNALQLSIDTLTAT